MQARQLALDRQRWGHLAQNGCENGDNLLNNHLLTQSKHLPMTLVDTMHQRGGGRFMAFLCAERG